MPDQTHPLLSLTDDEREFVVQFVLRSGSLKDLAEHYGVSYPTLRSRLDRVIEHLREAAAGRPADPMARLLGDLVERGELNARAARSILQLHRRKDGGETGHG